MHVILQGALSCSLYYVLCWYLDHSVFTLDEVNHFIQNFPDGYTELKDKPVLITNEDLADPFKNFAQTAIQLWLLARVFSFFRESYCDQFPDEESYNLYLKSHQSVVPKQFQLIFQVI